MSDVVGVLAERQKTHGDFTHHARITQMLKFVVDNELADKPGHLSPAQKETIDMIFHKIGRIIAGNPNVEDHWLDISGYSELARLRCQPVRT